MELKPNQIVCGDCIEILNGVDEPVADLIFADPPFNIGYKYDKYHDKVEKKNYIDWTKDWMLACCKALKPSGSFYIAIGDDYAANVKVIADEIGLTMRNWIIWHYTFGQQTKAKFARAHTHIFYFVKDKENYTFNVDAIRVFSDRQKRYKDKRANPEGKLPDDVWDEHPRLCGTFDEREGWHPCQMPESLLARIIRVSSNCGDCILDPFNGSGTTTVVAHKMKRNYIGIEISKQYVKEAQKRIQQSEEFPVEGEGEINWTERLDAELKWLYHENKMSTEKLSDNKYLLGLFTLKFNNRIGFVNNPCRPEDIKARLTKLRKSAKLGPLRGHVEDK